MRPLGNELFDCLEGEVSRQFFFWLGVSGWGHYLGG